MEIAKLDFFLGTFVLFILAASAVLYYDNKKRQDFKITLNRKSLKKIVFTADHLLGVVRQIHRSHPEFRIHPLLTSCSENLVLIKASAQTELERPRISSSVVIRLQHHLYHEQTLLEEFHQALND